MKSKFIVLLAPLLGLFYGGMAIGQTVVSYPLPSCYTEASQYSLSVNGTHIAIIYNGYGDATTGTTTIYNYAHFSFSGNITLEITASESISTFRISPQSLQVNGVANGNKLTFTLNQSKYLIVKINNLPDLVIADDDLETDIPAASGTGIFNVLNAPYNADASGNTVTTTSVQNAINDANSAGGGIVYVPAGVYKCGNIILRSNVSVYLAGGAVLMATGDPADFTKFYFKSSVNMNGTYFIYTAANASHIKIYGRGTVDGNGYYMRTANNWVDDLIVPLQCSDFTLDGIVCKNSGLWAVIPTRSDHIVIKNTKHFNNNDTLYEDDAVDIQECQDVTVTHTVMVSEDDAFSTKTWTQYTDMASSWPGSPEPLDNVVLDDCLAWSRCATFKIGFGSYQPQSNITVKNSTSYRSMRAIAVNPAYGGDHDNKNITFDNIDIEGFWPRAGNESKWLDIYTRNNGTAYGGPISNVVIKNINVRTFGSKTGTLKGLDSIRQVNGIAFENIKVPGQVAYATSLLQMNVLDINNYINNVSIAPWDSLSDNLALNKSAVASTTVDTGYAGKYAVDGNNISKWWSVYSGSSQTFYVDLGWKVYNIQKVSIKWADGFAQNYQLQVSDDAQTWTTVATVAGNQYLLSAHENIGVAGRYIRMNGTGRGNSLGYTISELEVKSSLYPPANLALPNYTPYGTTHYPDRIAQFKASPLTNGNIVFIGNSLTELGGDWGARLGVANVKNRGIASDHVFGVKARLAEIVYYKPATVFLEIGINDLVLSQVTSQNIADSISDIVRIIHLESPQTNIYVQTILPTSSTALVSKIQAANQLLATRSNTEPFTLINLYSSFADANGLMITDYTTDGTHLTEAGYQVWVNILLGLNLFAPVNTTGNLALHRPAWASTIADTAYAARYAVDGSENTKWWSTYGTGSNYSQYLYVDLGAVFNINKVVVKWGPGVGDGYGQNYNLQVSNDGVSWTTVNVITGNHSRLNEIDTISATGRYIKILGLGRGNSYGYTIAEFEVYGTGSETTLGVSLSGFAAGSNGKAAHLTWNAQNDKGFNHFAIEKGTDALVFKGIGNVFPLSYSKVNDYYFDDNDLVNGLNYYRLKMIENDGSFQYSGIVHIDASGNENNKLRLYPNPVHQFLYIDYNGNQALGKIKVSDISGRNVLIAQLPAKQTSLDVSRLSNGIYFVTVSSEPYNSYKFLKY